MFCCWGEVVVPSELQGIQRINKTGKYCTIMTDDEADEPILWNSVVCRLFTWIANNLSLCLVLPVFFDFSASNLFNVLLISVHAQACDILGIFLKSSKAISKRESHLLPQFMESYQMNTSFGQKILWSSVSPNVYLLYLLNDCPSIRTCLKLIRDYLLVGLPVKLHKVRSSNVAFAPMHFLPLTYCFVSKPHNVYRILISLIVQKGG